MHDASIHINPKILERIAPEEARSKKIVPGKIVDDTLEVYSDKSQSSLNLQNELSFTLGQPVKLIPLETDEINRLINEHYPSGGNRLQTVKLLKNLDDVIELLLREADELKSSDIHIEPYEHIGRIRIRIDGKLIVRYEINKDDYPAIVNKIKIRSNLDISEKRLPQDGRIQITYKKQQLDLRVSIMPSLHGEKIVLRILSKDTSFLNIHKIGMTDAQTHDYLEQIKKPHGIILISGPTGSGKTTTLYATLKHLNTEDRNVVTIEDPIEYTLEGINQVQLKEKIGLTFSFALRTFLRQDPDVIMLGEIRDQETAHMAIRAALTGHLVFSTIHTNSAWGIIERLSDMGVPSFLLANTLNLCLAQRLIRLLCPHCKKEEKLNPAILPQGMIENNIPDTHFTTVGCPKCYNTGYMGRKAIYEMIAVNDEVRNIIKSTGGSTQNILQSMGVASLKDQAMDAIRTGESSLEEVYALLLN